MKQTDLFSGLIGSGALSAPCKEDAAGQSSHSADAEAGDMEEQQHTVVQQCLLHQWLAMLCKIALMPQRESGLPLANVRAFRAATESSAKPCLRGSMKRICKQHDEPRPLQLCLSFVMC